MNEIKRENGEVMIESLVVYLVTFTLLFLILALMMISYQRFTIKTVATDAAVKAAQNFRYVDVDLENGVYTKEQYKSLKVYRYLFHKASYENRIQEAGEKYAYQRLMKTTFTGVVDNGTTEMEFKLVHDGPALRHIQVTISGNYKLPFDEILSFFKLDNLTAFKAVECAECVDIMDYCNYVDFSKTIADTFVGDLGKIGKLADKIWTLVNKIKNYS